MAISELNKPGNLVKYRDRRWMVMPSADKDLMCIKPLGGSDEEETAIYLPLMIPSEAVTKDEFPDPTADELGSFETAKLLFDASRLSFRNASGPFRCMGKLSFRPRSYQLVPLVMALKQDVTRLLIADDVGIGKTIEALIILKELMERGEIKQFAIVCPPHLCEQWQGELKDKLDIEAEIIRSSTAAKLDRMVPPGHQVFQYIPYQVISIDYIKADRRRGVFIENCPELLIVDEAHTCALPEGAKNKNQQQRHSILHDLAQNPERHLVMLTATPHSGKDSEFLSLLGLLHEDFKNLDMQNLEPKHRRKLADFFILRKRKRLKSWLKEDIFPERDSKEQKYNLSPDYLLFYQNVLRFARSLSSIKSSTKQTQMIRNWAAVALIRGVMSSPAMAVAMLENRKQKLLDEGLEESIPTAQDQLFERLDVADDAIRKDLIDALDLKSDENEELEGLLNEAKSLASTDRDWKRKATIEIIKKWTAKGVNPIIFCKFIATAKYVSEYLQEALPKSIDVVAVTSELVDEQRRERIDAMKDSKKRVLVATDCLSEGINLQELFTGILHYDLPWNPNRFEQREGRADRFGQKAKVILAHMLVSDDNPMDKFVYDILLKKIMDIHRDTGVTINIGDDSESIMTKAAQQILFSEEHDSATQLSLYGQAEETVENALDLAKKKSENIRSIFAHESIKPADIENDLAEIDEAIGDLNSIERFVLESVRYLGASCEVDKEGFSLQITNLPPHLKDHFKTSSKGKDRDTVKISFASPTPSGYRYIGRNHLFVEQLCQFMLALAFEGHPNHSRLARVSEIMTNAVTERTTLIMFRVRNVIKEVSSKNEVISEEMRIWGYRGLGAEREYIDYEEGKELLLTARSLTQLSDERQMEDIARELEKFDENKEQFIEVAKLRADKLVEAHGRFKKLVGGRRYEKATPVLPPDMMGIYILMPQAKAL